MVKKPKFPPTPHQRGVSVAQPNHASVSQDKVARERGQMVLKRQTELDSVLDRHDDMVRSALCTSGLACSDLMCTGPRKVPSRTVCDAARVRSQGSRLSYASGHDLTRMCRWRNRTIQWCSRR